MSGKPDRVRVSIGRTISIGNYESERVEVSISRDVEEDIDDTKTEVVAEVIALMNEVIPLAHEEVITK